MSRCEAAQETAALSLNEIFVSGDCKWITVAMERAGRKVVKDKMVFADAPAERKQRLEMKKRNLFPSH